MLYYPQKLVKWTLNQMFNTIHNCRIDRPTWNKDDSYGKEFFIYKRKWIALWNTIVWEVVDRKTLEWIEYILVKDWTTIKIMYKDWSGYTQLGTSKTITNKQPLTFEKWISARWEEKATWVRIWDAFFALNDKWTYNAWTTYLSNEIVLYSWQYYVSLSWSVWKLPTDKDYWIVYNRTESWLASWEPQSVNYNDEFRWWYLVIKLEWTWIDWLVTAWQDYVYFYEDKSNLQWIAVQVEYKKTIDANNILVYIRWTNKAGSRPKYVHWDTNATEKVAIYTKTWDCPVIATNDWVYVYNVKENWSWVITWANEVKLINLTNITDMCYYNWSIFVMNDKYLYYSHTTNQWFSTVNIYPLDLINIRWWQRLIPFWKILILLWVYDKIVTPINWTTGNIWFVSTDLNFEEDLFSKYSILSYMWSLYMIKSNKELVKINIVSINNISYQVETQPVLEDTKWIIDEISWEVYMCMNDKDLVILNHRDNKTFTYTYNVEYWHWSTAEYVVKIYKILNWIYYWNDIYIESDTEEFEQSIWFVVWTEDLSSLKQFMFYKMILWIESSILDYYLDVEYEIWWTICKTTIDLSNYPINMELDNNPSWLWDSLIWTSLLWLNMLQSFVTSVWNIVSANIWIWRTASLMRFTLRSKPTNWIVYWWSVVWYELFIPQVTEVWYKH